jgi:hypothetical protein
MHTQSLDAEKELEEKELLEQIAAIMTKEHRKVQLIRYWNKFGSFAVYPPLAGTGLFFSTLTGGAIVWGPYKAITEKDFQLDLGKFLIVIISFIPICYSTYCIIKFTFNNYEIILDTDNKERTLFGDRSLLSSLKNFSFEERDKNITEEIGFYKIDIPTIEIPHQYIEENGMAHIIPKQEIEIPTDYFFPCKYSSLVYSLLIHTQKDKLLYCIDANNPMDALEKKPSINITINPQNLMRKIDIKLIKKDNSLRLFNKSLGEESLLKRSTFYHTVLMVNRNENSLERAIENKKRWLEHYEKFGIGESPRPIFI